LKQVDQLHVLFDFVLSKNVCRLYVFLKPLQKFFGVKTLQFLRGNILFATLNHLRGLQCSLVDFNDQWLVIFFAVARKKLINFAVICQFELVEGVQFAS